MIAGIFHKGSGLGNQLHRYVATRVLALDKGYEFSMIAPENFKGKSFMDLDMGVEPNIFSITTELPAGKVIPRSTMPQWEEKTPYYNPVFNFIKDHTIRDGEFQDERYFEHRLGEIEQWLKAEPLEILDDVCVVGFRGGEFYTVPELGLPLSYYEEGIAKMREINPNMKFEVHTDDEILAKQFFPDFKIIHDVGINWRSTRCAKYAIVANSSFYIFPRLLAHFSYLMTRSSGVVSYSNYNIGQVTIAPRYWDRYNIKKWERPYNYYKSFQYI